MALTVELTKRYGDFTLDVAFSTNGGVLSLFGASGSGKSLTLRCIAGVVRPDRGHIELDGTVLFDSKRGINLPPQRRGVGYLFQNYALFPTMTAAKNIETGLMHVRDRKRRAEQAAVLLAAYRLTAQADLYPHQLSGGQQQRVALARALATNPRALLLDEPFSALDNHLRWQLEQELADTIETFPGTTLFISHSVGEVYRLADRVCVLENGRSRMAADKSELLLRPKTLSDALLVGLQNYSCADRGDEHTMYARAWGVTLRAAQPIPEDATAVGIRAADIRPGRADEGNALCCTVQRVTEDVETRVVTLLPLGAGAHMRSRLRMELPKDAPCPFVAGEEACVVLPEDAILCFREERG